MLKRQYPMTSIFKDMHLNCTSLIRSQQLCSTNPLDVFKGPSVEASFCFQEVHVHTSRDIFNNSPAVY